MPLYDVHIQTNNTFLNLCYSSHTKSNEFSISRIYISSLQVQFQTSIFSFNTLTDSIESLLNTYTQTYALTKKYTHPVSSFLVIGKPSKGVVWNILMHQLSKSILFNLKATDILSHSLFNSLLYPHASKIYRWIKNIDFIPWKHWLKHINISYKGHTLKSNISGFSILMS